MVDIKEILGGDKPEPTQPLEPKDDQKPDDKAPEEDQELKAKLEQKANLDKAIIEATTNLRDIRKATKKAKAGEPLDDDEDDVPKINDEDPSARAWNNRIKQTVAPVIAESEKEKEEVRTFALREFLKDRPSLAKNPEKLKQVMTTYDRIKTSSERTTQGVTLDLEKAYAAEHHEELIQAARNSRFDNARNDAIFSDPAVSRGSTAYSEDSRSSTKVRQYSEEEKAQLAKWGMTPAQHAEMEKDMKKKYG